MQTIDIVIIVLLSLVGVLTVVNIVMTNNVKKSVKEEEKVDVAAKLDKMQTELFAETNKLLILTETQLKNQTELQKERIESLEKQITNALNGIDKRTEDMRKSVEDNLRHMNDQNTRSLESMRQTVDEKLSKTLETRLTNSFELINKSLTDVSKGLGDMQNIAKDVGGLKNVLQNVKVRGTWAETQLDNLLSQMLTTDQYKKNVQIKKNSQERCDFAVVLPGRDGDKVLLPIDSKFPQEDYLRIVDASSNGNVEELDAALKALESRIKGEARSISEKYIDVPTTTDFALMYLPTEGLYSEVLRRDGLSEYLQTNYRVVVCGPNTIAAMLSSLNMGFKTVAIEKKSQEIRKVLYTFKKEFTTFTELLQRTQKKINDVSETIEKATKKTQRIEQKLGKVELDEEEKAMLGEVIENDDEGLF